MRGGFRLCQGLAAAMCAAAALSIGEARAGLLLGTYAEGHSNTLADKVESEDFSPIQQTITYQTTGNPDGVVQTSASTAGLGVGVDLYHPRGGYAGIDGMVQFDALPGTTATSAVVTWSVDVHGRVDTSPSGTARWETRLRLHDSPTDSINVNTGGVSFHADIDYVHEITHTVPLGVPVFFEAVLRTGYFTHFDAHGISNFLNTLEFNPNAFFTIVTPGVTANSVDGDWLVNNQLLVVVPVPATLALFGAGGILLGVVRRRRTG
jgi:hypothetical protein